MPQIQAARQETDLINVLTNWIRFCHPENIHGRLHIFDSKKTVNLVAAYVRAHIGVTQDRNLVTLNVSLNYKVKPHFKNVNK